MKTSLKLFLSAYAISQTTALAQTALFDINSDDVANGLPGANAEGWTALDIPNASTPGPFSATVNGITLSLTSPVDFRGRDRGTSATTQGADNNDNAVPIGINGDMYRDFSFVLSADRITGTASGLTPDTDYFLTIVSWDSGQSGVT